MKKIIAIVAVFMISFLLFNDNVSAEEYTCTYNFKTKAWVFNKREITFTVNTEKNTIDYPDGALDFPIYFMDQYYEENYTIEDIIKALNGGCSKTMIIGIISSSKGEAAFGIFFDESNIEKAPESAGNYGLPTKLTSSIPGLKAHFIKKSDIFYAEYNSDKSSGKIVDTNLSCNFYMSQKEILETLKCRSNGSICTTQQITEYNQVRTRLKSFCNNISQYANAGVSPCLDRCLGLSEDLNNIEDYNSSSACGFSERLIVWIDNIFKWIKYILPVLVIVLGILDFIKAIASDKDDEMKKAQGRFIKRLIAAALAFLIPLIITFILEKMGFVSESCGLW